MAVAVEENGREIVEVYLAAARKGDWRAAEALMNRIYGKPEPAVVAHIPANPALPVLKSMSLEKLELLQRLRTGELAAAAQVLPIVEAAPPGDEPPTPANAVGVTESLVPNTDESWRRASSTPPAEATGGRPTRS